MSDYVLNVPEEVYQRAQQIAEDTAQLVDQVMIDYLRTLSTPLPPDDALWTIPREQMASDLQAQMTVLMDKNSLGTITPDEFKILEALVDRGQRLMLRKSEAGALLTQRGYTLRPQTNIPSINRV